jgi:carbon-monoxide dehydrogenase medium subunit
MFVKPFAYERAATLGEACEMLRAHDGSAKVIAGGQSLMPMVNFGLLDLEAVVDVSRVASGVTNEDGYLQIGATTRHRELIESSALRERQPMLAEAAHWIGNARIRNRGTLGGSLAHSDPVAELPLAMVTLGAEYDLTDGRATRTVRADEFHQSYFATALADDELIASVRVPALGPGWGWGFVEISRRLGDFALVAAAALARVADGRVVESRLALAGVGERPLRLAAAEAAVGGATADELDERIGPIEGLEPVTDTNATAEHRRHLARVLAIRALTDAIRRGGEAA